MRRAASAALVALALTIVAAACGSATATPGMPRVHLTPTVELTIGCPSDIGSPCTTDPLLTLTTAGTGGGSTVRSVADSSVLKVVNDVSTVHRLTGMVRDDEVFDTGQMHEGNSTIVVLDTPGTVVITDTTTGRHTSLVVRPPPGTKG